MKSPRALRFSLFLCVVTVCAASSPAAWDLAALSRPPAVFAAPEGVGTPEGMRALCFEGPPFRGRPTRVFAWLGVPASATPENPAPGIVLVHGSGGTAFSAWVKLWLDRGYAAIAFDHTGGLPIGKHGAWVPNPGGGPKLGHVDQLEWPVADQWMHHAVADTLLAHSLLAAQPGVDARRIGATGISWRGVVVCNAAAVDARLRFAVPVYGCGFISEDDGEGWIMVGRNGTPAQRETWRALWDPADALPRVSTPLLWINGTNDFAFTLSAWQRSHRAAPGTQALSLRVRMRHAHNGPGESPEEIRAFADHIVNGGAPLARVTGQGVAGETAWVAYESTHPVVHAELNFTRSTGRWQKREWETVPAQVERDRASTAVPAGATAYYFNLIDDRGLIVSSEHVSVPAP